MKHLTQGISQNLRIIAFIALISLTLDTTCGLPTDEDVATTSNCPYNPCTPQRLGCQRLFRNELGCLLCKCENTTSNDDRPCALHGCTVELLQCSGSRLKKTEEGCTLCKCEDEEATTTFTIRFPDFLGTRETDDVTLPISPTDFLEDGDAATSSTNLLTTPTAVVCPELSCTAAELGCEQLQINPFTGCEECRCRMMEFPGTILHSPRPDVINPDPIDPNVDDRMGGVDENPCPNPMEILDGDQMVRGTNILGKKKPMYKLSMGKLKRGFEPGRSYKISLKAHRRAKKFRAFLFTVNPALNVRGKAGVEQNTSECGAGVLNDSRRRKNKDDSGPVHVRPIPHCPTQAIEADGRTNKSIASTEWTAPQCGCVYISVAVVDETNTVGYLDDAFLTGEPITTKINRHLIKTVCAKSSSSKRGTKHIKSHTKSWITSECCIAAYHKQKRGATKGMKITKKKCMNDATAYSNKQRYRYRVFKRTCTKAYKDCCVMSPKIGNQGEEESRPRPTKPTKPKPPRVDRTSSKRNRKKPGRNGRKNKGRGGGSRKHKGVSKDHQ